jgi:hypothetical protein
MGCLIGAAAVFKGNMMGYVFKDMTSIHITVAQEHIADIVG